MADNGGNGAGTPVTLVVPARPVPTSTPGIVVNPRPHLPFTGFDLSTALVLTALLLALGALLVVTGRLPAHLRRT